MVRPKAAIAVALVLAIAGPGAATAGAHWESQPLPYQGLGSPFGVGIEQSTDSVVVANVGNTPPPPFPQMLVYAPGATTPEIGAQIVGGGLAMDASTAYVADPNNFIDVVPNIHMSFHGPMLDEFSTLNQPGTPAVDPVRHYVYAPSTASNAVLVLGTDGTQIASITDHVSAPAAAAVDPATDDLWVLNGDGTISVYDPSFNFVTSFTFPEVGPSFSATNAIAFSPDGTYAYVLWTDLGANAFVDILDPTTHAVLDNLFVDGLIGTGIAVFADSGDLVVSTEVGDTIAPSPGVVERFSDVAPTVTPTAPTGNVVVTGATLHGTWDQQDDPPAKVSVAVYAGDAATGSPLITVAADLDFLSHTWTATMSGVAPGVYTAVAHQAETVGHDGLSTPATFEVLAPGAPVVTLSSPAPGAVVHSAQPAFAGTASTGVGIAQTATLSVYPGSTATGSPVATLSALVSQLDGSYSVAPTTALPDGTYTAQASQTDDAARVASATATFTVDTAVAPPAPVTTTVTAPAPAPAPAVTVTQAVTAGPPPATGPSAASVLAAARAALQTSAGSLRPHALLTAGGYTTSFSAPVAGTLTIDWAWLGPHRTTLAHGRRTMTAAGSARLAIALTATGRQLLRTHRHLTVTATATYRWSGGTATAHRTFVVAG
jgi:DNA-binding beta-propeller fold protein YncE